MQTNQLTIMTLRSAQMHAEQHERKKCKGTIFLTFVLLSLLWVSFPDCHKVEQPKAHDQVGKSSLGPEEQAEGYEVIERPQPHHFSVKPRRFTAIGASSTAALSEYLQQDLGDPPAYICFVGTLYA